ncbi:MAG: type II secretion system major pseudopilin GspG [Paracoccaceae bacterium]
MLRHLYRRSARRQGDAGVTLIEMMVVLVIIAIIAALIVPNVIGRPDEARVTVAKSDIRTLSASLELYRLDARVYPTTEQGLDALVHRPDLAPVPDTWAEGGYLGNLPQDPWGNPYIYVSPGQSAPFDLMSFGADSAPGGTGIDADLTNAPATGG